MNTASMHSLSNSLKHFSNSARISEISVRGILSSKSSKCLSPICWWWFSLVACCLNSSKSLMPSSYKSLALAGPKFKSIRKLGTLKNRYHSFVLKTNYQQAYQRIQRIIIFNLQKKMLGKKDCPLKYVQGYMLCIYIIQLPPLSDSFSPTDKVDAVGAKFLLSLLF